MKKVLLTSTALAMMAGAAAAEVTLSGSAEMGVAAVNGSDDGTEADQEINFVQDIDVTFTMSGETDGGLSFGASVDLDEGGAGSAAVANDFDDGGVAVFISGEFGTLTMGDTDGAMDWALTEAGNIANPGSLQDDETGHVGHLGSYLDGENGDGQIVRYDYSFGDFAFAVSVEQAPTAASGEWMDGDPDPTFAIGGKYNADFGGTTVALGVGYQAIDDGNDTNAIGVSAVATLDNGLTIGGVYTAFNSDVDALAGNHFGIGGGYTFDAFSVHANYGMYSMDNDMEMSGFGLAAAYDLGGGASIKVGYGFSDPDRDVDDNEYSTWSAGFAFSF